MIGVLSVSAKVYRYLQGNDIARRRLGSMYEEIDPAWYDIEPFEQPSLHELQSALSRNFARNRDEERALRTLAWWRVNDAFRDSEVPVDEVQEFDEHAHRANMEALLNLIDGNARFHNVVKGELLRELGEFEAAKKTLKETDATLFGLAAVLFELCNDRDANVHLYRDDAWHEESETRLGRKKAEKVAHVTRLKRKADWGHGELQVQLNKHGRARCPHCRKGLAPFWKNPVGWDGERCTQCFTKLKLDVSQYAGRSD